MKYASVCSGIEAATVAWEPLGWQPQWFAEIADFPSRVLAHHYPHITNHGDFTRVEAPPRSVDLLVGGTPCQSFSVAGKRAGLDDPRGVLALEFLRLARRLGVRWLVWENVPGVLSHDKGRTFGAILGALVACGYGFAYRVLDAQYFGLAQRRKRVFIVGHLGDWRPAAAVLFERAGLRGDPAPRREARTEVASTLEARAGRGSTTDLQPLVCGAIGSHPGGADDNDAQANHLVANTLRGEGHDASEDGTGRQPALVVGTLVGRGAHGHGRIDGETETFVTAFHATQDPISGDVAPALGGKGSGVAVCFDEVQITSKHNRSRVRPGDPAPTLSANSRPRIMSRSTIRMLTPLERERLQGFPDYYTKIPRAADGPRNAALGNSFPVPVIRWLGRRIDAVETLLRSRQERAA